MATAANEMPKPKKAGYSAEYRAEAVGLATGVTVAGITGT